MFGEEKAKKRHKYTSSSSPRYLLCFFFHLSSDFDLNSFLLPSLFLHFVFDTYSLLLLRTDITFLSFNSYSSLLRPQQTILSSTSYPPNQHTHLQPSQIIIITSNSLRQPSFLYSLSIPSHARTLCPCHPYFSLSLLPLYPHLIILLHQSTFYHSFTKILVHQNAKGMSYRQHYSTTATTNNASNSNSTCGNYSTPSSCRTQYETPYQVVDLATPSSPIQRTPSLSPWTFSANSFSSPTPSFSRSPTMPALPTPTLTTSYRDPLRSVHGSPRVAKIDHRPLHFQQHHTHHQRESPFETAIPINRRRSSSSSLQQQSLYDTTDANNTNVNTIYEDPSANSHRLQSSPSPPSSPRGRYGKNSAASPRRISLATSPRSSGRLPSLFDRIKAALEAPKRPTINTSPLPPIRTNLNLAQSNEQDGLTGCSSPTTTTATTTMPSSHLHPNFSDSDLLDETNDLPSFWCPLIVAKPTLFGIPCTEASQKAYSRHSSDVKATFKRLQLEDHGAVENRTIGKVQKPSYYDLHRSSLMFLQGRGREK